MSYTPTVWNENDIITAEKLNNLESGIDDLILDLGEVNIEGSGPSLQAEVSLTTEQFNKISNSYLLGVKIILSIQSSYTINCFLQKINLENSIYLYQNASLLIGNLNIEAYLLGSDDNYYLQILGEIKEAGEDSNIIYLGNFESTESLNNLTGNLDITLFNTNNLEVRFGIRNSYGGAYHKYNLPYLYNDFYSKEGHLWSEYYFGKEEVIEDILHSYRVTIDNKENNYHYKMTYKTYNLSSLISS